MHFPSMSRFVERVVFVGAFVSGSVMHAFVPTENQIAVTRELGRQHISLEHMQHVIHEFVMQVMPVLEKALIAAHELEVVCSKEEPYDSVRAKLDILYRSMLEFRVKQLQAIAQQFDAENFPFTARLTEKEMAQMHGQMLEQEVDELIDQLEEFPEVIEAVNTYAQPFIQVLQSLLDILALVVKDNPARIIELVNLYAELTPGVDIQLAIEKNDRAAIAFVRACTHLLTDYVGSVAHRSVVLESALNQLSAEIV